MYKRHKIKLKLNGDRSGRTFYFRTSPAAADYSYKEEFKGAKQSTHIVQSNFNTLYFN